MSAYYNEHDPNAAAWLRELIKHGHIADGEVDTRSIVDVRSDDLDGFVQCHFFAGIGGWSLALRLAGWPDDRPVWTGSCPCQPFSAAGKRKGTADERHLWPEYHRLIAECRPAVVLGEQVASKDGLNWLDTVFADLEGSGYAAGAADLCAAGLGAPHIRQRLWFVGLADAEHDDGRADVEGRRPDRRTADGGSGAALRLADADRAGSQPGQWHDQGARRGHPASAARDDDRPTQPGPVNGHWRDADWLYCRDGKWRPVEPGTFPLVDGTSEKLVRSRDPGAPINADKTAEARVMRLRGYGNAIVPHVAAEFIQAVMG